MKHVMIVAMLAIAACGGKKDDKAEKQPSVAVETKPAPSGSAGSATSAVASGSAVDVPTEQDFETQAKTDITKANVDAKVKAIEDQLGQQ